jgi:hypothetical protein
MKKIIYGFLALCGVGLSLNAIALGQGVPSADGFGVNAQNTTDVLGVPGAGSDQGSKLITSVKTFINWVLGLLSLIAFVILLYGGFQMVTAAGDETRYKSGFTVLKQAAIGLVFIGISWLVITLIFSVINLITT